MNDANLYEIYALDGLSHKALIDTLKVCWTIELWCQDCD